METEGELYKKIMKQVSEITTYFSDAPAGKSEEEMFKSILDEASKEFPFWGDELRDEYGIYNLQTTPTEKIAALLTKYDEWKKKWFGEKPE